MMKMDAKSIISVLVCIVALYGVIILVRKAMSSDKQGWFSAENYRYKDHSALEYSEYLADAMYKGNALTDSRMRDDFFSNVKGGLYDDELDYGSIYTFLKNKAINPPPGRKVSPEWANFFDNRRMYEIGYNGKY